MKALILDLSSHTGFAVFQDAHQLLEHGIIKLPKKIADYGAYPRGFLAATEALASQVVGLVLRIAPDVIVIEETNPGGRAARYDQKFLEYCHCLLLSKLSPLPDGMVVYISSSDWRRTIGLKLTKEQSKNNRKASAAMVGKETAAEKAKAKAAAGVKGKITVKHLAVNMANERFGLKLLMKDNDIADAICLGMAYFAGAPHCEGK